MSNLMRHITTDLPANSARHPVPIRHVTIGGFVILAPGPMTLADAEITRYPYTPDVMGSISGWLIPSGRILISRAFNRPLHP